MAISKAESPHSIISFFFFFGMWKILSEFFKALIREPQRLYSSVYPSVPHPYHPLSQQGTVYGTTGKLSFLLHLLHLLHSHLLLFMPPPSFWLVGMDLSDHTALGCDFTLPAQLGVLMLRFGTMMLEIFWRGGKAICKKEIWLWLMFGIWNGKISMNGMFYYLGLHCCWRYSPSPVPTSDFWGLTKALEISLKSQYDFPSWGHEQFPFNHSILGWKGL